MNPDSESPDRFVPPPGALLPSLPRPPPKDVDYIVPPGMPFIPLPQFSFWRSLHSNLARLTVNNTSATHQAFFIYPSPPKATGAFPKVDDVRISVYQSSKMIQQVSGSITFALPFLPTLNWANSKSAPGIIAIAGTEPISIDPSGLGEYTVTPEKTTWMLTPTMEGDDPNFGVLSIPEDSEPYFLSSSEIKAKNMSPPKDVNPGTIAISTDGLKGLTSDVRPFIGIGAVDPKFPYTIIPIMTWVVQPNRLYQITPDLYTWRVASGDPTTPGAIINTKLLTSTCDVTFNPAPGIPTNVYFQPDSSFAM